MNEDDQAAGTALAAMCFLVLGGIALLRRIGFKKAADRLIYVVPVLILLFSFGLVPILLFELVPRVVRGIYALLDGS